MSKLDRYIGGGVFTATLGVLLLLVGLDALTSVIDETDDIGDGYGSRYLGICGLHLAGKV